jgi:hypothetical protein
MQKPALLRAIYSELRSSLGPEVPGSELIRLAYLVWRAYAADLSDVGDDGQPRKSRSLLSLPVDEAMNDGGWRILDFETKSLPSSDERDIPEFIEIRPLIEKYLGPEWQHLSLTGQL